MFNNKANVVMKEHYYLSDEFVYDESYGGYQHAAFKIQAPKITTEMTVEEQNNVIQMIHQAYTSSKTNKTIELLDRTASREATILPAATKEIPAVSVRTQQQANEAIGTFDKALAIVSSMRVQIGAYMNRLEHTMSNVSMSAENVTAAESRIRDTDMAKEMINVTKQQILMQASTAMLGQANQHPSIILQLLA